MKTFIDHIILNLKKQDLLAINEIFSLYWNGQDFLKNLNDKIRKYLNHDPNIEKQKFKFFVAKKGLNVDGVAGYRKCPDHMIKFTKTKNPAELYVMAVKVKNSGIGKSLVEKIIDDARKENFTEIVLYSGETHKDSWGFYDHFGFIRVSPASAPNGERGFIWQMNI